MITIISSGRDMGRCVVIRRNGLHSLFDPFRESLLLRSKSNRIVIAGAVLRGAKSCRMDR